MFLFFISLILIFNEIINLGLDEYIANQDDILNEIENKTTKINYFIGLLIEIAVIFSTIFLF